MKNYNYKIQWLFYVSPNFISSVKELKNSLFNVLKALDPKSLDKIIFRDENLKIIYTYASMHMYMNSECFRKTKSFINKKLKEDNRIYSVELLRK